MHTDNEFIKTDVGRESSKAWRNNLPTKLIWKREPLLDDQWQNEGILKNENGKHYLGLEILAKRPGGANRVTAQSVSAALEWTSEESWKNDHIKDSLMTNPQVFQLSL